MTRFEEKTGIKVCYSIDILSGHVILKLNYKDLIGC